MEGRGARTGAGAFGVSALGAAGALEARVLGADTADVRDAEAGLRGRGAVGGFATRAARVRRAAAFLFAGAFAPVRTDALVTGLPRFAGDAAFRFGGAFFTAFFATFGAVLPLRPADFVAAFGAAVLRFVAPLRPAVFADVFARPAVFFVAAFRFATLVLAAALAADFAAPRFLTGRFLTDFLAVATAIFLSMRCV